MQRDHRLYWKDPQISDKYKLQKLLGQGSFGTVYRAKNRETGKKVAIKLITDVSLSVYSMRKLVREVIILRKLSKMEENIFSTKLLDVIIPCVSGGDLQNFDSIFLVMDYCTTDLRAVLDSAPQTLLSLSHIKTLLYNSLCSLKFIHSANIIHRDIKPENFLMDDKCRVLLCDFGLSRTMPDKDDYDNYFKKMHKKAYKTEKFKETVSEFLQASIGTREKRKRDMSSTVVSRWYRPPEVILTCKNYGQAVDIYSMGLVLYEMIYSSYIKEPQDTFDKILFKGDSCFPISPKGESKICNENDQLVKIFEKVSVVPEKDFSFISNDKEDAYLMHVHSLATNKTSQISDKFPDFDKSILNILDKMLAFNPNFRPTAEQLLGDPFFDDIRRPENEIKAPFKVSVSIDKNEFAYDYEKNKNIKNEKIIIENLKEIVINEVSKIKLHQLKKLEKGK